MCRCRKMKWRCLREFPERNATCGNERLCVQRDPSALSIDRRQKEWKGNRATLGMLWPDGKRWRFRQSGKNKTANAFRSEPVNHSWRLFTLPTQVCLISMYLGFCRKSKTSGNPSNCRDSASALKSVFLRNRRKTGPEWPHWGYCPFSFARPNVPPCGSWFASLRLVVVHGQGGQEIRNYFSPFLCSPKEMGERKGAEVETRNRR